LLSSQSAYRDAGGCACEPAGTVPCPLHVGHTIDGGTLPSPRHVGHRVILDTIETASRLTKTVIPNSVWRSEFRSCSTASLSTIEQLWMRSRSGTRPIASSFSAAMVRGRPGLELRHSALLACIAQQVVRSQSRRRRLEPTHRSIPQIAL